MVETSEPSQHQDEANEKRERRGTHNEDFLLKVMMISQFNGTSTPKRTYSAKTGDNDCNVNLNRYSLRTALCVSIRYQAKAEQNVRQDLIPRVRHGEALF